MTLPLPWLVDSWVGWVRRRDEVKSIRKVPAGHRRKFINKAFARPRLS